MVKNQTTRVSIVIPVYNEADQIDACLRAIAAQTVAPHEVIVVDNNSTDATIAIAQRYPFVRVITEPKQGVVHARTAGFNATRGDIIGRIDADTLLDQDWVASVQHLFTDRQLDAVSGSVSYHDLPWKRFLGQLDLTFRQWIANGMGGEVFLFGSNMALRRKAWLNVRQQVCNKAGLHEDFDLAIHLYDSGASVRFDRRMQAAVSLRRFDVGLRAYWSYVWLSPRTYQMHHRRSQTRMYPVVLLVVAHYWLIRLLFRSYDAESNQLALRNALTDRTSFRVNPTTFVD